MFLKCQNNWYSAWRKITKFVLQLGRYEPSFPVNCCAPCRSVSTEMKWSMYSWQCLVLESLKLVKAWRHLCCFLCKIEFPLMGKISFGLVGWLAWQWRLNDFQKINGQQILTQCWKIKGNYCEGYAMVGQQFILHFDPLLWSRIKIIIQGIVPTQGKFLIGR